MLPEDRKQQGLLLEQSIQINTSLPVIDKFTKFFVIDKKLEKKEVVSTLAKFNTKYRDTDNNVSTLSGGNQQKVSLSKWILSDCECLILDEPTRGVDVGAKTEIYKIIEDLAQSGLAIILISSEMAEIIGMCDRVLVMREGQIAGELTSEISEEKIIKLAMGV
jgi:ribose transport system ATP-binding protein